MTAPEQPTPEAMLAAVIVRDTVAANWAASTDGARLAPDLLAMIEQASFNEITRFAAQRAAEAVEQPRSRYADMLDGDLLNELGDNAAKWAAAFCDIARSKGLDVDEGWMIGWFANAIEHSSDVRKRTTPPPGDAGRGHLTADEIAIFDKALRASSRVVHEGEMALGDAVEQARGIVAAHKENENYSPVSCVTASERAAAYLSDEWLVDKIAAALQSERTAGRSEGWDACEDKYETLMPELTAATTAASQARREALLECAEIAKKYRSEAELEQHRTADGEGKECWLWAFDTSNAIEREIRALAAPQESA